MLNLISLGVNIKFELKENVSFIVNLKLVIILNGLFAILSGFTTTRNSEFSISDQETGFSV